MSLRVTCLQWFNAELPKAQSLTAVLVGELCKAAYDLLEAAAPLTYKQQQSIRRYTAKLLSHITRATIDCDSQSRIVWPSEETRIWSLEYHTLISRQCRHLLKGQLQRRWCLEFIIVCPLCQAAYTLLVGLRRRTHCWLGCDDWAATVYAQIHGQPSIAYKKGDACGCDSQSTDVWPREETNSLSADTEQDEETNLRKAILEYADADLISALCKCAHNILRARDRTIDIGREGTPEDVQEQTAPDSK